MVESLDQAVWDRTSIFDRRGGTLNAAWLLGTVACRQMLLDGPLKPDGGEEAEETGGVIG